MTLSHHPLRSRYGQLFWIILAVGSIYTLVYIRINYQDALLIFLNIRLEDLNNLYSFLGLIYIFSYIPSGWLADLFPPKYLLSLALLFTGLAGFVLSLQPPLWLIYGVFFIWGISSVALLWGAQLKLTNLLAGKKQQGQFFGFLCAGRGLTEALLSSLALILFSYFTHKGETNLTIQEGLRYILWMYSLVACLIAGAVLLGLKNDIPPTHSLSEQIRLFPYFFKKACSNHLIWYLGGIIFLSYSFYSIFYILGSYFVYKYSFSFTQAAQISLFVLWFRPLICSLAGIVGDKVGRILSLSLILGFGLILGFSLGLSPMNTAPLTLWILIGLLALIWFALRGLYWSLLDLCDINPQYLGLSIGIISFIAYSSDIILPQYLNKLMQIHTKLSDAYTSYIFTLSLFCLFAIILSYLFFLAWQRHHTVSKKID